MSEVMSSLERDSEHFHMPVDCSCAQSFGLQIISPFPNVPRRYVLDLFVRSCSEIVEKPCDDHLVGSPRAGVNVRLNVFQPVGYVAATCAERNLSASRAPIHPSNRVPEVRDHFPATVLCERSVARVPRELCPGFGNLDCLCSVGRL